ncbi:unnamed protein product, partial [marine sediment metagenome]
MFERMKVMFTGHRDRVTRIECLLWIIDALPKNTIWLHGGAKGFDTQVDSAARRFRTKKNTSVFYPDYKSFTKYGAPHVRNDQMLELADLVVACWDGRKRGGTYSVIRKAR